MPEDVLGDVREKREAWKRTACLAPKRIPKSRIVLLHAAYAHTERQRS